MNLFKSAAIALANVMAVACCPFAGAQAVTLDVTFKLTDIDYHPLPDVPVRLVFGCDKNWQSPASGLRFTTDEKGEAHVTTQVVFDKRMRIIPTNYIGSLLQVPVPRNHLLAGAELDYLNFRSLYMVDIICLPDGTTMQDNFMLYTADEKGQFTNKVEPTRYAWLRPDYKGYVFQGPGFQPWDYSLLPDESDPAHKRWKLTLAFKKSAPPVKI